MKPQHMNHGGVARSKCFATYRFLKVYDSNPLPLENPPHDLTNSKADLLGLMRNLVVPVSAPATAGPGSASSIQIDAQTDAGRLNSAQSLDWNGRKCMVGLVFNGYLLLLVFHRHCIVLHICWPLTDSGDPWAIANASLFS